MRLNVKRVHSEYGPNVPFKYSDLKKKLIKSNYKCEICDDTFKEKTIFGEVKDPVVLGDLESIICPSCLAGLEFFNFDIKNLAKAVKLLKDLDHGLRYKSINYR